ncbi:MAG: alpha/beta fold hydrolase [Mycobacterium kyogaense]|uniref:alpha/beta hydrolase n=1 Tax=Mycobacterium kyogaense TaxID=2212479 RepID=UPI002FFB0476
MRCENRGDHCSRLSTGGRRAPTIPTPLLFVHGAWHAAWCWDEHFLGWFADRGYRALALSLRGHGASGTDKPLNDCTFDDFEADVAAVAGDLGTPPVLIGHSMGGFVVQKYLETHDAPAAVLMASMPPAGLPAFGSALVAAAPLALREDVGDASDAALRQYSRAGTGAILLAAHPRGAGTAVRPTAG